MRRFHPSGWPAWKQVPLFVPVPARGRCDGWTARRQTIFIGVLAETGSVARAARAAGPSRESAYRLRRRPDAGSFAHAWDAVLALREGREVAPRKFTGDELVSAALDAPIAVRMHTGRFAGAWRKPSFPILMRLLGRIDGAIARSREAGGGAA